MAYIIKRCKTKLVCHLFLTYFILLNIFPSAEQVKKTRLILANAVLISCASIDKNKKCMENEQYTKQSVVHKKKVFQGNYI